MERKVDFVLKMGFFKDSPHLEVRASGWALNVI